MFLFLYLCYKISAVVGHWPLGETKRSLQRGTLIRLRRKPTATPLNTRSNVNYQTPWRRYACPRYVFVTALWSAAVSETTPYTKLTSGCSPAKDLLGLHYPYPIPEYHRMLNGQISSRFATLRFWTRIWFPQFLIEFRLRLPSCPQTSWSRSRNPFPLHLFASPVKSM